MNDLAQNVKTNQLYRFLLVAGIVMVSFNLRPAITAIGPIIGIIRDDLGLSNWSVAMLTSLPLIAFAFMSPIAPKLASRFTNERTLLVGLFLLLLGIGIRTFTVVSLLFIGTLLAGFGIAICNVLLPSIVKEKFPLKVGLMTSIYSTTMALFAALASGLSVPLAHGMNLGWHFALLVWAIPVIVALFIWMYLAKHRQTESKIEARYFTASDNRIWRSRLAWQVAAYMGLQSFIFYVTVSWLPEILVDNGVSMATAGWMTSFSLFIGLPASFLVPVIAERYPTQHGIVIVLGSCLLGGFGGLLFSTSYMVMMVSIILIGIALNGCFSLALAFIGMRARNARQAAELSGMAQSPGYIMAALGPIFIGYLFDLTKGWTIPLITLLIVAVLVISFGFAAARDKYVLD